MTSFPENVYDRVSKDEWFSLIDEVISNKTTSKKILDQEPTQNLDEIDILMSGIKMFEEIKSKGFFPQNLALAVAISRQILEGRFSSTEDHNAKIFYEKNVKKQKEEPSVKIKLSDYVDVLNVLLKSSEYLSHLDDWIEKRDCDTDLDSFYEMQVIERNILYYYGIMKSHPYFFNVVFSAKRSGIFKIDKKSMKDKFSSHLEEYQKDMIDWE